MTRESYQTVIAPSDEGMTLAAVVRAIIPDTSWSRARTLCRSGRVRVDGELAFEDAQRMKIDAVVEVEPTGPRRKAMPLERDRLVHVDAELVVVRKPVGLVSVPYDERDRDTLVERTQLALRQKAPLGVVQRLDKDTSGLLVFARTRAARKHLQNQFRAHSIVRRYLAVVAGDAQAGTHDTHIVPNRGDGKRGSWRGGGRPPRHARGSVTHVEVLEQLPGATLVACKLETGRQHQIRIHLAEAGHPLAGERIYAASDDPQLAAARPMLHAATLGFRHPANDRFMQFEDPIPEDFRAFLERLRALPAAAGEPTSEIPD